MRGGKIVDRREFFWEDLPELPESQTGDAKPEEQIIPPCAFHAGAFFSALLKQLYIDQQYVPRSSSCPVDFADRDTLAALLPSAPATASKSLCPSAAKSAPSSTSPARTPSRATTSASASCNPRSNAIQEVLQDILTLPDLPRRIECFDISHIQGTETVASMVVWENGAMKKSDYRKFQIKSVDGVDDFASMREVVTRRYRAHRRRKSRPCPASILIDGGLGQLHAAAAGARRARPHTSRSRQSQSAKR